uniref:Uncharacterized protein n=1 Tax=Anguilla anguilla TaxID=7936 RepID=A0A0E9REJ4_ANGAN
MLLYEYGLTHCSTIIHQGGSVSYFHLFHSLVKMGNCVLERKANPARYQ